ncbi:MAG: hypothetical protein WBA74_23905 [Cyclobacteriaceae bacterium]
MIEERITKVIIVFAIAFGIIIMIVGYFILLSRSELDLVEEFDEIRNTETEEAKILRSYHQSITILDSLLSLNQYENALILLDTINEIDPRFSDNYCVESGIIYYELGRFEEAKGSFTKAIEISESSNFKAYIWRAYTYSMLNNCDSAVIDAQYAYSNNSMFETDYETIAEKCNKSVVKRSRIEKK